MLNQSRAEVWLAEVNASYTPEADGFTGLDKKD